MQVYSDLRNNKIQKEDAIAIANVAGKIIGTAKVLMDYSSMKNSTKNISMLEESPAVLELQATG